MELSRELLVLFFRIATIYPLLLIFTLLMGRRSIAELPVFDFLIILTLSSVVGADLADPNISHIHTGVAVILISIFQIIVAKLKIRDRRFGKLITFGPTIVIKDGIFLHQNMKKIRYSLDNILTMLRENNVFDVNDVSIGIIEANGQLSIQKKPAKETVRIEDLGITRKGAGIAYPVIIEGHIHREVLERLNLNEGWLISELNKLKITQLHNVFFASVNEANELHVTLKDQTSQLIENTPPIFN